MVLSPECLRFVRKAVRYGAGPSFRTVDLSCHSYLGILGVHAPACLCTRLFTSSRFFAVLLRATLRGWMA
jgi:hypothetical protein